MKSTTYFAEITNQKAEKYRSRRRKQESTCLLASCQLRNFPREFIENCFAVFDQSSRATYHTWSLLFLIGRSYFSRNWLLLLILWYDFKIQVKSRGGGIFLCLASSVNVRQKEFFLI